MAVESVRAEILQKVFELLFLSCDFEEVTSYLAGSLERIMPCSVYGVLVVGPQPRMSFYLYEPLNPAALDDLKARVLAAASRLEGLIPAPAIEVRISPESLVSTRQRGRLASVLNVPVLRDGRLLGLITIACRRERDWKGKDMAFLNNLAEVLGNVHLSMRREVEVREKELVRLRDLGGLKDRFVSALSHELRSPLAILTGQLELLAEGQAGPINPAQRELVACALEQGMRLKWLTENLLDTSRIEHGTTDLSRRPARVDDLVHRAVHWLRHEVERKEMTVDVEAPGRLPRVCVEPNRLTQVLVNLIHNAAKYTERGGRLRVELRGPRRDEPWIQVAVSDTGRGIPAEQQVHVFDRFYRLGREIRGAAGAGLGLSIAKEIVEAQGGRIWLSSQEGRGSTFYFTVPAYHPERSLREWLSTVVRHADELGEPLTFVLVASAYRLTSEAWEIVEGLLGGTVSLFHVTGGTEVLVLASFGDVPESRRVAERLLARLEDECVGPYRMLCQPARPASCQGDRACEDAETVIRRVFREVQVLRRTAIEEVNGWNGRGGHGPTLLHPGGADPYPASLADSG